MAFKALIAGVDKTTSLIQSNAQPVQITRTLNERTTATFTCKIGFVPNRFDDVKLYEVDGTTLKFGGVVLKRTTVGIRSRNQPYETKVDCGDYFTYLDWTYITLAYTVVKTLKQVLTDLVALLPASYGITLDAAQVTGPNLDPFNWAAVRASDAIRELSTRTGYTVTISASKALKMFVPGTDAAPFAMTDGAPHCRTFELNDTDTLPANDVYIVCGPTGPAVVTQTWTVAASPVTWAVDIQCVPNAWNRGLVSENGSVDRTVSAPGGGGYYYWDETVGTGTLSVGLGSRPANGTVLSWVYTAAFPFTAHATSGGSPVIQLQQTAPKVTDFSQGQEIANGVLSQSNQQPRDAVVTSLDTGWLPGQLLTVSLTARTTSTFVIASVTDTLQIQKNGNAWICGFSAVETTVYRGSYLDQWRQMTGSSSGTASLTGGGSTSPATVLTAPVYMGGSTATAVTNPTSKTLIPNASAFVAQASFTGLLRVNIRARDAAVGVKAIISDGTTDTPTSVVTSQTFTATTVVVSIVSGHTYRVYLQNNAAGDGYCEYATLEAT